MSNHFIIAAPIYTSDKMNKILFEKPSGSTYTRFVEDVTHEDLVRVSIGKCNVVSGLKTDLIKAKEKGVDSSTLFWPISNENENEVLALDDLLLMFESNKTAGRIGELFKPAEKLAAGVLIKYKINARSNIEIRALIQEYHSGDRTAKIIIIWESRPTYRHTQINFDDVKWEFV